jgi:4-alpha-glucanotransferase
MSDDTSLRALAERLGILSSYLSQDGSQLRSTSDETRVAILAVMGYDASSEARAHALLEELKERERERVAEPACVVRESELRASESGGLRFHVPESWGVRAGERVGYVLAIQSEGRDSRVRESSEARGHEGSESRIREVQESRIREGGEPRIREGGADVGEGGYFTVGLAPPPAPGYYDLRVTISAHGRRSDARQRLMVVPERCVIPERRGFGIVANLYSIRGARSWGVGDLTDLAALARWSGEGGAAFVGVNPLHALRTVGSEVSPYSPVSRLYRNSAYLDVEAVPELAECEEAWALLGSDAVRAELARLRTSDRVEYERKARLARPILDALYRCFARGSDSGPGSPSGRGGRGGGSAGGEERQRAYAEYREREGRALDDFAVFMALDEHISQASSEPVTWQNWPGEYQVADSPAVGGFVRSHEREVDFHRWLQFELDRQLSAAAAAGSGAGLAMGLYQDLAVASAPYGSDVWARPAIHASGASIGAPPDDYSATGQNWGLAPLDPHRLRDDGYRFWTALVRSALRHAGAIRIDHVLGLFRQFWIPAGMSGADGAYVRFPTRDLMGILALESARANAVIVGEDLGTVPPEVPGTLREWGILGTRVLLFERERDRTFRPATSYEPLSLATADTHDLPTLAGFWEGRDIELAAELGRIAGADAERAALRSRQNDRRLLADRLIADGAWEPDRRASSKEGAASARANLAPAPGEGTSSAAERASASAPASSPTSGPTSGSTSGSTSGDEPLPLPDATGLVKAVHRFLCSTPAVLVGISLDDLAGETEPVNLPGVSAEHFASWTRRMRTPLAKLLSRDRLIPPSGCQERSE